MEDNKDIHKDILGHLNPTLQLSLKSPNLGQKLQYKDELSKNFTIIYFINYNERPCAYLRGLLTLIRDLPKLPTHLPTHLLRLPTYLSYVPIHLMYLQVLIGYLLLDMPNGQSIFKKFTCDTLGAWAAQSFLTN